MHQSSRPEPQRVTESAVETAETASDSPQKPAWTEPTIEEVSVSVTEAGFVPQGADGGIYS